MIRDYDNTFGPHAVRYRGPKLSKDQAHVRSWETSDAGRAATARRRNRTRNAIRRYRLVQARHALAMQKSGTAVTVSLLVALDHLLERYDEGLQSEGLEPSNLHLRLWESHRKLATKTDNKVRQGRKPEADSPKVGDIGFSAEERGAFCREMASKIVEEEMLLEYLSEESSEREQISGINSDCSHGSDVSAAGSTAPVTDA